MDSSTGKLYPTREAAIEAGVLKENVVEIEGPHKAIRKISAALRASRALKARKKRKQQKASRAANRRRD